jgi:hypothetical protein
MRVAPVLALSVVGIVAGLAAAPAADLSLGTATHYAPLGWPAPPLLLYAWEPGVTMRAYWLPPWRDRHYFPHSKRMPRLGRREHLSARGRWLRPAPSYLRSWSNAPAYACPPLRSHAAKPVRCPQ